MSKKIIVSTLLSFSLLCVPVVTFATEPSEGSDIPDVWEIFCKNKDCVENTQATEEEEINNIQVNHEIIKDSNSEEEDLKSEEDVVVIISDVKESEVSTPEEKVSKCPSCILV